MSVAQRKDQVKCYTPRGSGCMLVPEAIFFKIICHFKKVFTKWRSGSGVWEIKEKCRRVGVLQEWSSTEKHMGKLKFVQDWYRRNTVGGIQPARCDFLAICLWIALVHSTLAASQSGNTVGWEEYHPARCHFPCNLPLDCPGPLHPGNLPGWTMQ